VRRREDIQHPFELPEFARDTRLDPLAAVEALELLGAESGPPIAPTGAGRLLAEVRELPLRYAPFFGRLGELWDLDEDHVRATLARAKDPRHCRRTALPGVRVLDISGGPTTQGARTSLLKFSPGLRFPRHRHEGPERVLVLEGSYVDSDGRRVGPGELQEMTEGSEHGLSIAKDKPCIAALLQFGMEWSGPVLRWVAKVLP